MPVDIEPLSPRQLDKVIEKLSNPKTPYYGDYHNGAWQTLYAQELKPPLSSFEYHVAKRDKCTLKSWASITAKMYELGQPRNNWDFDDIVRNSFIQPSYCKEDGHFTIKVDEIHYDSGTSIDINSTRPIGLNSENLRKISVSTTNIASNIINMLYTVYTRKGTVRREHVDACERPDTKKAPDIIIKPLRWVGRK